MTVGLEVATGSKVAALLHPLRLRILRELREPDSASGLSRKLGLPRQKLNYHLRELEEQGLLELVEERRKGNCTERLLQARARSFVLDPSVLGELSARPEEVKDRFSSTYLLALAARAIEELAVLRQRAAAARKKLPTLSLQTEIRFRSAGAQRDFAEDLTSEIARLAAKYHDEKSAGGRRFKLLVGSYPTITKKEGDGHG